MASIPYSAIDHAIYVTDNAGITFAGQGEPDADFISATFINDTVSSTEGVKGDVQDSIRVAKMGEITFTCQWGSDTNKILNQVYEDQNNGLYMQRLDIKRISNTENTTVITGINPKLVKLPDYALGQEGSDRAYVFRVHEMTYAEKQTPA